MFSLPKLLVLAVIVAAVWYGFKMWDRGGRIRDEDSKPDRRIDAAAEPDLYRAVLDTKGLTMFRVIEAVVGSGAFIDAIGAFGASTAYEQVSFDDFEQAVVPQGGGPRRAAATATSSASSATGCTELRSPATRSRGRPPSSARTAGARSCIR